MKKGFTIIELVISMGLYSIVLILLTSIFASLLEVQLSSTGSSNVEQDGKYIISRMIYDMSRSTSITTPATKGAQSSTWQFSDGTSTYTYALNSGNLTLTTGSDSQNLNGFNTTISNLTFTRLSNTSGKPTLKVSFRVTSKTTAANKTEVRDFNTTLALR